MGFASPSPPIDPPLKPGHFIKSCKSLHRCKVCQKPHHSLLHIDSKPTPTEQPTPINDSIASHAALGLENNLLLMTCQLLVESPEGMSVEVRGILDSASSASFISERLAQTLKLKLIILQYTNIGHQRSLMLTVYTICGNICYCSFQLSIQENELISSCGSSGDM